MLGAVASITSSSTRLQMISRTSVSSSASTVSSMTRTRISRPQPARQRRTLSSMSNMMSPPPPTPLPVGHVSMAPPRIVSRRAWQQQQQQQQRLGIGDAANVGAKDTASAAKTATAAKTTAEKPWPASVRYTAYIAAVTVIPYMIAWIISYNQTLRSLAFKDDTEEDDVNNNNKKKKKYTLQDLLRWQFGTEDEEEAQTTTRYEYEDDDIIPKQFPNEWPFSIRTTQAAIRSLEQQNILVRIGILTNTDDPDNNTHNAQQQEAATTDGMSGPYTASLGDMQVDNDTAYYYHLLPGSTPARIDAIIKAMKSSAATTTSDNIASRNNPFPPLFISSLSLDFEDVVVPSQQTKMKTNNNDATAVVDENDDDNKEEMQQSKKQQRHYDDSLLKQTACFSLWHYQDAAVLQAQVQQIQQRKQQQQTNSTASNNKNDNNNKHNDTIELARLEYQVQQYQNELNNAANSLRAVDDIRHDLQQAKTALKHQQRQIGKRAGGSWSWSLW